VRLSPTACDTDQQGSHQARQEQGDGASQPVAPSSTHIPDQQACGAHGKDEFDSGLQCHANLFGIVGRHFQDLVPYA
jgi:hypothetical protein